MQENAYYREYAPHPALARHVACYWAKKSNNRTIERYRILPDACADIIFNFSDRSSPLFLAGIATTFMDHSVCGNSDYFGIRFKPGGLYVFLKQPLSAFTNTDVSVRDFSKPLHEALLKQIRESDPDEVRTKKADALLLKLLLNEAFAASPLTHAVETIFSSGGSVPVKLLAQGACMSERQLQRRFTEAVGISPKTLSTIARFMSARQYLRSHPGSSLADLCCNTGYYDHSHVFKDFVRFTGKGPFN